MAQIGRIDIKHLAQIDKIYPNHLADTGKKNYISAMYQRLWRRYYIIQAQDVRPIAQMEERAERGISNSHTRSKTIVKKLKTT